MGFLFSCTVIMDVKIIDVTLAGDVDTLAESYPCFLDVSGTHSHEIPTGAFDNQELERERDESQDCVLGVNRDSSLTCIPMEIGTDQPKDHQDPVFMIESLCQNLKNALIEHISDQNVLKGILNMNTSVLKIKTADELANSLHLFGKESIEIGSGTEKRSRLEPIGTRRKAGKS